MELPKNAFYKKTLDEEQSRCAVCSLTKNYRGWLSTYADMLGG